MRARLEALKQGGLYEALSARTQLPRGYSCFVTVLGGAGAVGGPQASSVMALRSDVSAIEGSWLLLLAPFRASSPAAAIWLLCGSAAAASTRAVTTWSGNSHF